MVLIKSISGIRGTIGGKKGDNLTPLDMVKFASAYGTFLKDKYPDKKIKVVIGRDARISGEIVSKIISSTLLSLSIDVIDLGLSTTPTVEMAVPMEMADGGIIFTASHNPKEWNALKLLNSLGEFIDAESVKNIICRYDEADFEYSNIDELGKISQLRDYMDRHIDEILKLEEVRTELIKSKPLKIVVDGVDSTGGIAIPKLLDKLGCEYIKINCEPTGDFSHNPEPLEKNLKELQNEVLVNKADLGIAVDPDVDRLVFVCEDGTFFGEEYSLVAISDYILSLENKGNTVSNLSSSMALKYVTEERGGEYFASAVGEMHVVKLMKEKNAVIGGEGNGGIIFPKLHYGRDALVGIALFLSLISIRNKSVKELRESYPDFYMGKFKVKLNQKTDIDELIQKIADTTEKAEINTVDGLKIIFEDSWVHLRKSNTEPIIRIYTEAKSQEMADKLGYKFQKSITDLMK